MNTVKLSGFVAGTAACLLLASCSSSTLPAVVVATPSLVGSSQFPSPSEVVYNASYPGYESIASLYKDADIVATVHVKTGTTVAEVHQLPIPPGDPQSDPYFGVPSPTDATPPPAPLVQTIFTAKVLTSFKGTKPGRELSIGQIGGVFHGITYKTVDEVPLVQESEYVVFLRTFPEDASAPAVLLNPDQAVFAIGRSNNISKLGRNDLTLSMADLQRLSRD